MLKVNTSTLQKQLSEYKLEVERRLKYMVAGFAKEITEVATSETPIGDADALMNRPSYRSYYETRNKNYGIDIEVGFHQGAWVYSEDMTLAFDPSIYSNEEAEGQAFTTAKANYKLGDTFYIMAVGPGYSDLNNGSSPKAPDGIIAPSMQAISTMYSIQLVDYYKKG